eukprot:4407877-Pyramimonas_sp.AAC.2
MAGANDAAHIAGEKTTAYGGRNSAGKTAGARSGEGAGRTPKYTRVRRCYYSEKLIPVIVVIVAVAMMGYLKAAVALMFLGFGFWFYVLLEDRARRHIWRLGGVTPDGKAYMYPTNKSQVLKRWSVNRAFTSPARESRASNSKVVTVVYPTRTSYSMGVQTVHTDGVVRTSLRGETAPLMSMVDMRESIGRLRGSVEGHTVLATFAGPASAPLAN